MQHTIEKRFRIKTSWRRRTAKQSGFRTKMADLITDESKVKPNKSRQVDVANLI